MGSLSDYSELELLDHCFNAAYSPVATVYVGLATADPTDAGIGSSFNECADANGYARTAITFSAAASRVITQTGVVEFPQASGAWGTVTHWAILDGNTHGAGNMLAHGAFAAGKAIVNGNTPSIADTSINVTISANEMADYLAVKLLDLMFRNQAYSAPATYIGLTTAVVADADTGTSITEVSGGSYARKQVDVNAGTPPTWDVAVVNLVDNTHAVTFVTATAEWGTVTSVVICDAATLGNLLFYDNDQTDQLVGDGDTVEYPIGDLDITLV